MPVPNCDTGRQPSRIPGNIGTLKSKVMVWDHDPFWARPTQIMVWPFSEAMGIQMQEVVPNAVFELGSAFLRPTFKHHDMFVCTLNDQLIIKDEATQSSRANSTVDLVGSPASGVGHIAQSRLPGGDIYECNGGGNNLTSEEACAVEVNGEFLQAEDSSTGKDIFPHQLWKYKGSLLRPKHGIDVLIHPSDYQTPLSSIRAALNSTGSNNVTSEDLASAAKWDYIMVANNGKLSIWPIMITKQSSNSLGNSVHWTLEKWTPIWQGQDFSVSVRLGDKRTDDTKDPSPKANSTEDPLEMSHPYEPFMNYNFDLTLSGAAGDALPGITNQAFHVVAQKAVAGAGISQDELNEKANKAAREAFDWRFKTYIMVEVGVHDPLHNYFIELRKGSHPRFLHLGEEWDSPTRLKAGVNANPNEANLGFNWFKKCRQIGDVYKHVTCDQLFKGDFKFSVRNHLGRIVITFEGYEGQPWVISRLDNDPRKTDFTKVLIPMVVPAAPVRIHGGNISCAVNYTPTEYLPFAVIPFVNRQVDTGPDTGDRAVNGDVYLTFSQMGNQIQYTKAEIKREFFSDPRFLYDKVGYDCDAYVVHEKNKNASVSIPIYETYKEQYKLYGKGWFRETPRNEFKQWEVRRNEDTGLPEPTVEVNGMSTAGGRKSHLQIVNARDPSQEFPLTLDEATGGHYEWKDFIAVWDVGIELQAGSIAMNPPSGDNALPVDDDFQPKIFENYITPIATNWRLIVLGGGKSFEGAVVPFNIAPLVMKIADSWSSEDFHSLNHEMQMECYIPIESTSSGNPENEQDEELLNLFNLGRKLLPLHDKAFYLTVSYWWNDGIGHRWVESNLLNRAGDNPDTNDVLIQMTGLAYGAQLTRSNNRLIMSFTIKDYMSVLENQMIFNSPFFDAVQDVQAVYELGKLAGLADESDPLLGVDRRPLGYLRKVLDDGELIGERLFMYNGEQSRSERYDLPGTFASLSDPSVKFQNGESYENAVKRIATLSGKTVYFDRWGVLRLETPAALIAAFSSANENITFEPVFDFVSTPIVRESNVPDPGEGGTEDFVFDPTVHAAHLVYNSLTYQRSVEECANQIIVMSASNDIKLADGSRTGGFIIEGYTFFDQIYKPESEGFIGYRKPLYQQEGSFGSIEGVRNAMGIYAKKKFPPVIMSFETYGVPGLKALDIITLDGNLAYITEIAHELDPATNRWWMTITSEWLKPFKGELGFLETTEPSTSKG